MADRHGNTYAIEGVTRCACGVKYWEDDHCVDCGAPAPKPEPYDCQLEFGEHEHANEAEALECQQIIERMGEGYPEPDYHDGWYDYDAGLRDSDFVRQDF